MTDIIEYAEAALASDCPDSSLAVFVPPLITALKAARAENERLQARPVVNIQWNDEDGANTIRTLAVENERLRAEMKRAQDEGDWA